MRAAHVPLRDSRSYGTLWRRCGFDYYDIREHILTYNMIWYVWQLLQKEKSEAWIVENFFKDRFSDVACAAAAMWSLKGHGTAQFDEYVYEAYKATCPTAANDAPST